MTQLATNRIKQAEYVRNIWHVTPEQDVPFDTLLDPKYWAHVSAQFKPCDRIEVNAEDGSYFAELIILDAGRLFAKVQVLRKVELKAVVVSGAISDEYEVKWAGPSAKWRVLRKADNAPLKEGFTDRAGAEGWLVEHQRAVAA